MLPGTGRFLYQRAIIGPRRRLRSRPLRYNRSEQNQLAVTTRRMSSHKDTHIAYFFPTESSAGGSLLPLQVGVQGRHEHSRSRDAVLRRETVDAMLEILVDPE